MRQIQAVCECGEKFIAGNETAKYCPECKERVRHQQEYERHKRKRLEKLGHNGDTIEQQYARIQQRPAG